MIRSGLAILALVLVAGLAAPRLAAVDPIRLLDPPASRYLPPGAQRWVVRLVDGRTLLASRVARTPTGLSIRRLDREEALPAASIANLTPRGVAERIRFPLGTDKFGRDVWSRLVHGARVSLLVGGLATLIALVLGLAVGGTAAVLGGWIDGLLMRGVDGLLALPRLFLLLGVTTLWRPSGLGVALVLGATSWMTLSRLLRGQILTLMGGDMVAAARATGRHPMAVFWRHVLPNALAPLLVEVALRVGDVILLEAALSFLGFGVQPPAPSWGNMIAGGREALTSAWWVSVFPGAAIALTVLAFNLVADGLQEAWDPQQAPRPGR